MPFVHRTALPALCLSLILPCAFSVEADDPQPAPAEQAAAEKPAERQPLLERSQEDAAALERVIPPGEQQSLQAGSESFLALWKPANSSDPKGMVIIIPSAGETADWPQAIGPLRNRLPDADWSSLSLTLPDLQSDAAQPRIVEAEPAPAPVDTSSKDAATAAPKPIEQAAGGEAEIADHAVVESSEEQAKADVERIFARIDAAVTYAQQQNARSIVLLGHGSGAYWATRYLSEKQPPEIQKLVLVAAQTPSIGKPGLAELTPTLKLATADFFYKDNAQSRKSALERLQASKRLKNANFTQISLNALPGNSRAENEQLFRRVRGWLSPQPAQD
ncbi:alpha/beta hydrolase family protein [Pseudomonas chlororaphis]|uniref:alpha/beta hydrolase family protein n=1 Tax=Pseudomonas chlororaphis TaxID=587753 RepID=UPI0015DD9159|nr:alpha/beta hydrolase family protein [Pseudomonas chlororaphis]QLL12906.1 alpha/beta hydrolase family protein [Pseudomonas chlororaphis subsp. aurantiaca]